MPTIADASLDGQVVQARDYAEYAELAFTAERPHAVGVRLDRRVPGAPYGAALQNALAVFASYGHAPDLVQFHRDLVYLVIPDTGEDARAIVRAARASFTPQPGLTRAAAIERLRVAVRLALIDMEAQLGAPSGGDGPPLDSETEQALAEAASIGAVLDALRDNGYDYPAAVSVLIAALVVDAGPDDDLSSSYEWSTWPMPAQPIPGHQHARAVRRRRWNLRISEDTQSAAQGLLDDREARYGDRLTVVRPVHEGRKREWLAYVYRKRFHEI